MRVELDGIKSSPPTLPSPAAAAVHTSGSSKQQENVWSHTDVFCRGWPEATRNTLIQIYLQQIVDQYPELGGEVKETQMTHPDFLFLSFPNSDLRGQFLKKIRDNRPPPFCFLGKSYVIRITAAQPKELRDKEKEMKASFWLLTEAVKTINPTLPPLVTSSKSYNTVYFDSTPFFFFANEKMERVKGIPEERLWCLDATALTKKCLELGIVVDPEPFFSELTKRYGSTLVKRK